MASPHLPSHADHPHDVRAGGREPEHPGHGPGHHGPGHHGNGHHGHGPHGHGHGPGRHVHAPASYGRAFAIGIALNLGFVGIEAGYGFAADSVALLADAGHNLSDVLGLAVAWIGTALAGRGASARFTYGLRGASILAALANAVLLLVAVVAIGWEAIGRLMEPQPVGGVTVMAVAGIGILVNGATAWLFASGGRADVNIRGAYLHMVADAAVSAGVVASGLAILATGANWLDPAASLAIAAAILWSTWGLLRDSLALSLAAVPPGLDLAAIRAALCAEAGVAAVHDLHVWAVSTTEVALTAHAVMPAGHPGDDVLVAIAGRLRDRFGIGHATIQVEITGASCPLAGQAA